ncbi:MAG: HAMP domain-containing sensor histidine kinase [Actinomycetota bacterium]|nr:HAMP domain-containing sensor histidine kinase [Actinomycetota bacterium]MEE3015857.1 HAMP domain-containing sensor histidine kinase [Actinomycetota bacterium]
MIWILCALAVSCAAIYVGVKQLNKQKKTIHSIDDLTKGLSQKIVQSETVEVALRGLAKAIDEIEEQRITADAFRQQLIAALDSLNYGIAIYGQDDQLIHTNPYASSFLSGVHSGALIADAIDELFQTRDGQEVIDQELDVFDNSHPSSVTHSRKKTFYIILRELSIEGNQIGSVVTIEDISEQERLESVRRDFISNISHELKTPIGAIALLTETLLGEPDTDLVQKFAPNILQETERLSETIDDLLSLSRIEHGSTDSFNQIDLLKCIEQAIDRVNTFAKQNEVTVLTSFPPAPVHLFGDELQLTSAFYNILENSVKYKRINQGNVHLTVQQLDDFIEVEISDNGIGIPTKDLDRIFERFYCVDRSHSGSGVGLGLAIVRHVIVNHEGVIRIESTEGVGTTFFIQFPINSVEPKSEKGHASVSLLHENEVATS